MTNRLDRESLDHLLRWVQDGVVARRQILEFGGDDNDIARMVRRHELHVAAPGVYINHTGTPNRAQRNWIAVLSYWPAALDGESALPRCDLAVVRIAVDAKRRVTGTDRIWVRRLRGFDERVDWHAAPPRIHLEHATIDVMVRRVADDDIAGAFTVLADVCFTRRTTPAVLARVLEGRVRVSGRATLAGMITDLRDGICSILERGYVERVEQPHGLPPATRQHRSRSSGHTTFQDIRYDPYGVIVEPDGRAHHDHARARDRDARRDLAELAVCGDVTARVTYGMVFDDSCWTAVTVATLLRRRGWDGEFVRCPRCPRDLIAP